MKVSFLRRLLFLTLTCFRKRRYSRKEVNEMANQVLQAIHEMQKEMREGFKSINERLDMIDKTLTRIDEN